MIASSLSLARAPVLAAIAAATAAAAQAAPVYKIVDLGANTSATAINVKGSVLGVNGTTLSIYKDGAWTPIAGAPATSAGAAINKSGAVAGQVDTQGSGWEAATWNAKGKLAVIGVLAPGSTSYATGISDDGTVVGYETSFEGAQSMFTYANGTRTEIPCANGAYACWAWAVNASGQIAGGISNASQGWDAFVYTAGTWTDIGTLGGFSAIGQAINAAGHVAGASNTAKSKDKFHAFLYDGKKMVDLGTLSAQQSWGLGIDDADTVVGYTEEAAQRGKAAFVYFGGTMYDLASVVSNGSGWHLNTAVGINHKGQIVGNGAIGGVPHAFLLNLQQ